MPPPFVTRDAFGCGQVLTKALQAYKGSMIVVSHNRNFCELLAPTHVGSKRMKMHIYDAYKRQ